jgi:hypothetical protein
MNIHLFNDSLGHYTNLTVKKINTIDNKNNLYYNFCSDTKNKISEIKYVNFNKFNIKKLNQELTIKRIFIHYYSADNQFIVNKIKSINKNVVIIWCFWSGDYYNLPQFLPRLYGNFSSKYLPKNNILNNQKLLLKNIIKYLIGKPYFIHNCYIKSFEKIDFFAAFLESDFKYVINNSKTKHLLFSYVSIENILGELYKEKPEPGRKIMINHSADPTLNHYEAIEKLYSIQCEKEIWLPLAYGDEVYKSDLINAISKFELNIEILHNFIPLDQYNLKLKEIGIAIFNIKIQQAFGNIVPLIWLGVKVFLSKESSIYLDLKKKGIHIYNIDEISSENLHNLDFDKIYENRKILMSILSEEKVNEYLQNALNIN